MKFENSTGNIFYHNEFELLLKILNSIFNGKASIDKAFVKQVKLEVLINLYHNKITDNFVIIILIIY